MKSSVVALVVLGLSAFGEASRSRHAQVAASKRAIHQLFARQSIDPASVPATCDSQCLAILSDITTCEGSSDITCICNTNTENSFVDCMNCMLSAANASPDDISTAQTQIDQYIDVCNSAGVSLPSVTVGSSTSSDTNTDTNTDTSNTTPTDDAATTLDLSTATATIDPTTSSSTPALVASVSATSSSSAGASTASADFSAPMSNGASVSTGSLGVVVASFFAMVGGFVAL